MRISVVSLLISLLLSVNSFLAKGENNTPPAKIKRGSSINVKRYKAIERFGKIERAELIDNYALKYRFNSQGDTIEISKYQIGGGIKQGSIDTISILRFNNLGQKIEENAFDNKGNYFRYDYFYNKRGQELLINQYDIKGEKKFLSEFKYDGLGRIVSMLTRSCTGDTIRHDRYQYFRSGTFQRKVNPVKGKKNIEVIYSFDKKERVYEKKYYVNKKIIKSVYLTYNDKGELITQTDKEGKKPTILTTFEYDQEGKLVYKRVLNTTTNKASVERYTYIYNEKHQWLHRFIAFEKIEGFFDHGFVEDREYFDDYPPIESPYKANVAYKKGR